jgi:hypothetical protein
MISAKKRVLTHRKNNGNFSVILLILAGNGDIAVINLFIAAKRSYATYALIMPHENQKKVQY